MSKPLLTDKTVVLTGATGGIGAALAIKLMQEGASLILVGRDAVKLEKLGSDCRAVNHKGVLQCVGADLATEQGLSTLQAACAKQPIIDILINGLGVNDLCFLENQSAAMVENIIHTNLVAPVLVCRALLPQLKQQARATILNIGSTLGSIGFPGYASYCASKFGLRGFTEALRRELSDTGITVHYLSPRSVKTSMNSDAAEAMNRALNNAIDDPQVVAAAVCKQLRSSVGHDHFIGWPEKLFVRINHACPAIVTQAISKQLATVRRYALRVRTELH